ncbi:DNA cytosine methyltransferase [Oscillospiraceae bacterium OttesenSCG-928-F05]|nr:DNA cytosine methyltransferase [Oscillospiraceae bacterium OttesenSCG-928-F05]
MDEACNRVLDYWWPGVPRWKDVRDVTGDSVYDRCGNIDLLFGGPPCQPVSVAGRRGAAGDSRNLWPEFIRAIRELRPQWIVAENPTGIISAQKVKGYPSEWPKGEFFGEIVRDITALGYSVGWGVWGACDVGAPHKRERVFIVAHRQGLGRKAWRPKQPWEQGRPEPAGSSIPPLAYADGYREQQPGGDFEQGRGRPVDGRQGDVADPESQQFDRPLPPRGGRSGFADSRPMGDTEHHGSSTPAVGGGHAQTVHGSPEGALRTLQPPGAGTPGVLSGEAVGNTGGAGLQERDPAALTSSAGYFAGERAVGTLADAYGGRQGDDIAERRSANGEVLVPPGPSSPRGDLGDTQCRGRGREPRGRSGTEPALGCAWDGRGSEPGVGRDPDGLPARVDFPGWPAGRGAEQYPWEPPRVVPGKTVAARTHKIKMLGNAVVPEQAEILFSVIAQHYEPE